MISPACRKLATDLVAAARARGLALSTAESCTGGMVSAALTSVSGSSAAFTHGFVTYANEAKRDLLGVPQGDLDNHGAVSREVAEAMARGALRKAGADLAVAITGIAGPGGGSPLKPVGLVWFGLATRDGVRTERRVFAGPSRQLIREHAARQALRMLLAAAR
jgi:nicotinamide-nucleotide amidase